MISDEYGQIILNKDDIIDLLMQEFDLKNLEKCLVDDSVDASAINATVYKNRNVSVNDFDALNQQQWFMPEKYHQLDIVNYILDRCNSNLELERAGEELVVYQEKNLFDLLRYLVYMVDVMKENKIIWGVGRGSSVSSYVLYLIGVHKINSIEYDLDYKDFLR